jgi:hypothetical protein
MHWRVALKLDLRMTKRGDVLGEWNIALDEYRLDEWRWEYYFAVG